MSKAYLAELFRFLSEDPVLPDLAFSYQVPRMVQVRGTEARREAGKVVGISPIAYCHPDLWPIKDQPVYDRYVAELSGFVKYLLHSNYQVVFFRTATADKRVTADIRERIGSPDNVRLKEPFTGTLESLFTTLEEVDLVVASRLHGVILSHVIEKPVLAIAFEPKVYSHMEDTHQTSHCLDIRSVTTPLLIDHFLALEATTAAVRTGLKQLKETYARLLDEQYDRLACCL